MEAYALTRASTIGPIADVIEASGGSVARVFRAAELPLKLIEQPDHLILLRDQFLLLEAAAREIGDDAISARLSIAAGVEGLGPYGRHVMSFGSLGAAIATAYQAFGHLLQASTRMELTVHGGWARWSYAITEPIRIGRQKNEMLALGYMLEILRRFAGPGWLPRCVELPGALQGRKSIEDVFACDVANGDGAAVVFPADLLELPNPSRKAPSGGAAGAIPAATEFTDIVEHMIELGLLSKQTGADRIASRLGLTTRTLQRRLSDSGHSFGQLSQKIRHAKARELLGQGRYAISDIAFDLGYSDAAHFTRAFHRWTGETPRRWRLRETGSR